MFRITSSTCEKKEKFFLSQLLLRIEEFSPLFLYLFLKISETRNANFNS
ncbi:hypothetical protein X975_19340, partial [Stegodyphus mimosarum]